jgi:pimeloyl-ACP methyl ester carboxylesterase
MWAMVEGAGVELAYRVAGTGDAVLLVHDMASDGRSWDRLALRLGARARVVSYDRRGYGASGRPEPYLGTTVYEQTEDAAALAAAVGLAPAIVCGVGFGALVALDLGLRHAELVRALVCVEPPLFAFVAEATEILAAENEALRGALQDEGPQAAVARWRRSHRAIDFTGDASGKRELHANAADEADAEAADAGSAAFFADFAGLSSWPVTRAQLRAISAPLVVLTGPATRAHLLAAADALARFVPTARRARDGDLPGVLEELLGPAPA